jgi:hypothetical protein
MWQDKHVEAFGPSGESLGIGFEAATPFDTPRLMAELVEMTRDNLESGDLHPLINIALFIVVFLEIHPFQDGNGRLSRILTTSLLLRSGYAYVPYSSLESFIEQSKIEQERLILGDLPELSVHILELCRHRGRVTMVTLITVSNWFTGSAGKVKVTVSPVSECSTIAPVSR